MAHHRHIVYINEFFHPDICASAVVLSDQLPRLLAMRPDLAITVMAGDRAWDRPDVRYEPEDQYRGVRILRVARPAVPPARRSLWQRARGFIEFGRAVMGTSDRLGRVDLVIGTTAPPHGGRIARQLASRLGCPFVYRVLDLYPDIAVTLGRLRRWNPLTTLWRSVDSRTMRAAAAVVTVTQAMSARIIERRGISPERVFTLYDGYDPAAIEPHPVNDFKRQFNPDGRFVVQYAGNMGLSHPLDTIIGAALRLAHDRGYLFQFVGDGPRREAAELELAGVAQFVDYQPAEMLGDVLAAADMCLISQHPGIFDQAIPYKIYSNLAAGRPIIFLGSPRSEIAHWLRESGAGVQVSHGDGAGLIAALRRCRDDETARRTMGLAARRLFDERFHCDAVARTWSGIIDAVLGRPADA